MKAFELSHDSWHMKLANFGKSEWSRIDEGDRIDFCSYSRRVMWGAILSAGAILGATAVVGWIGFSIWNVIAWFIYGTAIMFPTGMFLIGTGTIVGIIAIFGAKQYVSDKISDKIDDIKRQHRIQNKQPGFFKLAYRKFKDKTCFMLEVK